MKAEVPTEVVIGVRTISSRSVPGGGADVLLSSPLALSSPLDCGESTQSVFDIDPDDPANISFLLAFEWTQVAPQIWCLNDAAPINMLCMLVTLDTSHFEISTSNDFASLNIPSMSPTLGVRL